jgi:hypothetical protein
MGLPPAWLREEGRGAAVSGEDVPQEKGNREGEEKSGAAVWEREERERVNDIHIFFSPDDFFAQ